MSKTRMLFPRNLTEDRVRTPDQLLARIHEQLNPEEMKRFKLFAGYFHRDRFYVPEIVAERWVEEAHSAIPTLSPGDLRYVVSVLNGYVSWRQMHARRCTSNMMLTKMGKTVRAKAPTEETA
jgi:hypothetical protein